MLESRLGRLPAMPSVRQPSPTERPSGNVLRDHAAVWWFLAAAIAVVWFASLAGRHLVPSDEGRYAEIAREMLASGDAVTIRYQGLLYFEKPPLQMWATALAYRAFGIGEWQARLWTGLCGAIGVLVTALAARRWWGDRIAALTALALVAMPAWVVAGHVASLDMGVSAALAVVLGGLLLALHPQATPRERSRWMLVAWAAAAAAMLTKGLIGIALPALVLGVHALLHRSLHGMRTRDAWPGLVVFLAIAAPWFVLASWRHPAFAHFFFVHEHFQRYTSEVHGRAAPWWYFLPQIAIGLLPWLGLLPAMARAVRDESRPAGEARTGALVDEPRGAGEARTGTAADPHGLRPLALLATWAIVIVAFFSASGSKLPGYIVPIYPALAILAAVALDALPEVRWRRLLVAMAALFALGVAAALLFAARVTDNAVPGLREFAGRGAGAAAIAVAASGAAWWLSDRARPLASRAIYAVGMFAAATATLLAHETIGGPRSGAALVPAVNAVLKPDMPIYAVRYLDHTLPFYLRRTTVMVAGADELAFGTEQEPDKWIPTLDAFRRVWTSGAPALALMSPETRDELRAQGFPLHEVAADRRRVVVANVAEPRR